MTDIESCVALFERSCRDLSQIDDDRLCGQHVTVQDLFPPEKIEFLLPGVCVIQSVYDYGTRCRGYYTMGKFVLGWGWRWLWVVKSTSRMEKCSRFWGTSRINTCASSNDVPGVEYSCVAWVSSVVVWPKRTASYTVLWCRRATCSSFLVVVGKWC